MLASGIVAHAGEEILLLVAAGWLVYLLVKGFRSRNRARPDEGPCLYCGTHLSREAERCPTCGFRARPGEPVGGGPA